MPQIDLKNAKSPYLDYSGPVIPNYNFSSAKYARIGSSDTMVGRMFGNYYDTSFIPEASQTNQRYYNTGTATAAINNILKLATAIPRGAISTANVAFSAAAALTGGFAGYNPGTTFINAMDNGPIGQVAKGYKGMVESSLPLHVRDEFNEMDFFQQLTRPGELFTSSNESLQFLVEMFATGGIMASGKLGTRLANYLAKNKPLYKALTPLKGPNVAKMAGNIDFALTNTALTTAEAFQEAMDSKKQSMEALTYNRLSGFNNFTDEEIEKASAKAAENVFWENAATLAVTNGVFMKLLKPIFKSGGVLSRDNKFGIKFKNGEYRLPEYAGKNATKFDKFLFDKGYAPGVVTKALMSNVFSEGLEESLQYSIQKVNELDNSIISDKSLVGSFSRYLNSLPLAFDMSDPDRVKAAGLGALLGGGQVAVASTLGFGPGRGAADYRKERDQHIESLNTGYTDFVSANIFMKEPDQKGTMSIRKNENGENEFVVTMDSKETLMNQADYEAMAVRNGIDPAKGGEFVNKGSYVLDDKGQPVKDPVKISSFLKDVATQGELDDYIEQEGLREDPDPLKLAIYKRQKLAVLAQQAFMSGTTDILLEQLDQVKSSTPQEMIQMGIDPDTVEESVPVMQQYVKDLEHLWGTVYNTIQIASNSKEDNELNAERRSYVYRTGARMITLDTLLRQVNSTYDTNLEEFASNYKEEDRDAVKNAIGKIAELHYEEEKLDELFAKKSSLEARILDADLDQDIEAQRAEKELQEIDAEFQKALLKRRETNDYKDLPYFNELSNNSAAENLAQMQNKRRYLTNARESLGKQFDQVIHTTKGFDFFKTHKNSVGSITSSYDKGLDKIKITDETTNAAYDLYEDRMVTKLRFEDKVNRTSSEFYAEYVNEFIKWYDSNVKNVDGESVPTMALNFAQLLSNILDNRTRLYPETIEILKDKLTDLKNYTDQLAKPIETKAGKLPVEDFIEEMYMDPPEGFNLDAFEAEVKAYEQAQEVRKNLGALYSDYENVLSTLDSLEGGPIPTKTEEELRIEAARRFQDPGKRIISAALNNKGEVSEDYTDEVSVSYEISKLEILTNRLLVQKPSSFNEVKAENEALIRELKRILQEIKRIKADRAIKNKKENLLYASSFLSSVGIDYSEDGTPVVNKQHPLYKQVEEAVTPQKALAIATIGSTSPIEAAKAVMDILQSSADKESILQDILEEKSQIKDFIEANIKGLEEDVIKSFLQSPIRVFKYILASISHMDVVSAGIFDANIDRFIKDYDLVKLLETRSSQSDKYTDRSEAEVNNEIFDQLLDAYLRLVSLSKLEKHVQSDSSNMAYLGELISYATAEKGKPAGKPTPSSGQERVISELASWLTSAPRPTHYVGDNIATLKAPPGAGKSLVITPLALRLAGLTTSEVMSAASTVPAAQNIAESLGSTEANTVDTLIEALESGNIPEGVTTIVVDEVGPIYYKVIDKLMRAFAAFNRENTTRPPLKMLFIYDPNQVISGYKSVPDIEEIGYSVPGAYTSEEELVAMKNGDYSIRMGLAFTQHLEDLTPLTVSYRSDVAEIVDLFSKFANSNQVVSNVAAASSVNPKTSTRGIMGTYVETDNTNLLPILQKSIKENPDRTRAVIVGSPAKKETYRQQLSNSGVDTSKVSVLTVEEVQGLTLEEVYVDVDTSESPTQFPGLLNTPASYNKYMNTAISRASKFAYVANVVGTNVVDPSIPDKALLASKEKMVDYDEYISAKKTEQDLLKKLTEGADVAATIPTTEKMDTEPTTEEEVEEKPIIPESKDNSIEETISEDLEEELDVMSLEEDIDELSEHESTADEVLPVIDHTLFASHEFLYPENYAFSDLAESPAVAPGDEILFVKDTYTPSIFSGSKERILVVRREQQGVYRKVAVLSEREIPIIEKKFNTSFSGLKGMPFTPSRPSDNHFVVNETPLIKGVHYQQAFLSEDSRGVTYKYDYGEPAQMLDTNAKMLALFNNWAAGLLGPDYKNKIENYDEIIDSPSKHIYIKSFSSPQRLVNFFAGRKAPRILPKLGVPYMFIEGIKLVGDDVAMSPQFIRTTSTVLKSQTPLVEDTDSNGKKVILTPRTIKEFASLVEEFQNELKRATSLGIYSTVEMGKPATNAKGVPLKDTTNNNFYPFHALVKALSQQFQKPGTSPLKIFGVNKTGEDTKGISDSVRNMFPDIPAENIPKKLLLLAARIDSMQHFGDMKAIESGKVKLGEPRNFSGHAQKAMNKLAMNNFFVTLPNGTSLILRDYEDVYSSAGNNQIITAKRLLGPVTLARRNKAYNPLLKESIIKRLESYAKSLSQRGLTNSVRYQLVADILSKRGTFDIQTAPLTLEQLKGLIVDGVDATDKYTNISEGFGLRSPTTFYIQDGNETKTVWNVGTTFRGVSPTTIKAVTVKPQVVEQEAPEPRKLDIAPLIQANYKLGSKVLIDRITKDYTEEEINAFIRRMQAATLEEAVKEYMKVAIKTDGVRKLSVTLKRTVENISGVMSHYDTDVERLKVLYEDSQYWEDKKTLTRKEDSTSAYGPRDTVRLAVLIKLFPDLATSPDLMRASVFFRQAKWYYSKDITEFLRTKGATMEDVIRDLTNIVKAAEAIARSYGLDLPAPTIVNEEGAIHIQNAVEYIAETVGSQVRLAQTKSGDVLPLEIKQSAKMKLLSDTFYSNGDTVRIVREDAELAKQLSVTPKDTDESVKNKVAEFVLSNNIDTTRSMPFVEGEDIGTLLNDDEAIELYNRLLPKRNIPILSRIFRSKKGEAFRIISFNRMQRELGKSNWGLYKDGMIYIARHMSNGKVGEKVVRHEIFHKIFWEYLNSTDRAKLLDLSRQKHGNMDLVALEERLAEDFMNRDYENPTSVWTKALEVIYKILRFLGFTINNLTSLDAFFSGLDSGLYAGVSNTNSPSIERDMKIAKSWRIKNANANLDGNFGPVESFSMFEEILFEVFDRVYNVPKSTDNSTLLSFEEAIEETFNILTEIHNDPASYGDINPEQVREALYPVLDPNGQARKDVLKEYFPQSRKAERLATQIADIRERYNNLYEQLDNLSFTEDEEARDVIQASLEELTEELGIKEEMFQTELRNPKDKLTGRVKQRFSSLKYFDKRHAKFAEFSKVFNILLDTIPQTTTEGVPAFVDAVLSNLASKYSPRAGVLHQRSVGAAVSVFMRDTFIRLRDLIQKDTQKVYFHKDVSNLSEYVIIGKNGNSPKGVTRTLAKENPDKFDVMDRTDGESLHEFARRVGAEHSIRYDEIRNAYYLFEEVVFVTSLISAVASLRTNKPNVGVTYYNWGMKSERYYPNRRSGPQYIMETDLSTSFAIYTQDRRNSGGSTLFESSFLESLPLPNSNDPDGKLKAVNKFLDIIGVNKNKRITSLGNTNSEQEEFYFRFYHSAQNMNEQYMEPPSKAEIALYGDTKYRTGEAIMADEGSLRSSIAEKLNNNASATQPTSYRRGDGKQAYRFIDASHQSRILTYLENAKRVATKGRVISGVQKPDHLYFEKTKDGIVLSSTTPLIKNNIFVNNNLPVAQIKGFIDHDALKTFGRDRWAKTLSSENPSDSHRRNFNFGFLSAFRKSRGNSYIQFLPSPADRTTIQGVEVTYLNPKQITTAVSHIIKSELNRPSPKEIGLENNESYVKRWELITFPGIYSEKGLQVTRTELTKMAKAAGLSVENLAIKLFTDHVSRSVDKLYEDFKSDFQGKEIVIDEDNLTYAASRMDISINNFVSLTDVRKAAKGVLKKTNTQKQADDVLRKYEQQQETLIKQVLQNFYKNYLVNQYSLANLMYGDQVFYSNKENETKRIKIITATGDTGLIDDVFGMPAESNVAIIDDIRMGIPTDIEGVRDDSFGEEYDSADGQGYVLPSFYEKMSRAYSVESRLDVTIKPVYFNIDDKGSPVALKYSLVVLTDELVNKFPHLKTLRDRMLENKDEDGNPAPIDQAVFNSAVKVGNPLSQNLTKFSNTSTRGVEYSSGDKVVQGFHPKSIIKIKNKSLLIQLNPAKNTDGSNANPSQATAFMNTNGLNTQEISKLHTINSSIIDLGTKRISKELEISAKGGLSKHSLTSIRKRLIKLTDDLPGSEDINVLLSHKEDGEYAISMDIPLLARRVTASIASVISRSSVSFRFPGSKFVLQAQAGTSEDLKWKDENGYTEVILPDTYRRYFNRGDVITNGLVAFRIPSTNYHSVLALKVKEFYPAPTGSQGNVIIAPSLIVHYHGSDYDIDTLFVIRKSEHEGPAIDLNTIIRRYDLSHRQSPALVINEGDVYGFGKENIELEVLPGVPVYAYLESVVENLDSVIQTRRAEIKNATGEQRKFLIEQMEQLEEDYYKIIDIAISSAQNSAVHLFSTNLTDPKNRTDLLTPISFNRASVVKKSLSLELERDMDDYIDMLKEENIITETKYCL